MDFKFSKHADFLEVEVRGFAGSGEMIAMVRTLLEAEPWTPGTSLLVDESAMAADKVTVEEVKAVAGYCASHKQALGHARVAIVVSRDLEYGMNRMFLALVETEWDADCKLFRSREEAIQWLA